MGLPVRWKQLLDYFLLRGAVVDALVWSLGPLSETKGLERSQRGEMHTAHSIVVLESYDLCSNHEFF